MKKLILIFLAVLVAFTACGKNDIPEISVQTEPEPEVTSSTDFDIVTAEPVITPVTAAEPKPETTPVPQEILPEEFVIRAKPNDNIHYVSGYTIIDYDLILDEANFPNQEHLRLAKQEFYERNIEFFQNDFFRDESGKNYTANDVVFEYGVQYDFDADGKNESIIMLSTPFFALSGSSIAYINENDLHWLVESCHPDMPTDLIIEFEDFTCLQINYTAGASFYGGSLYSFSNSVPEKQIEGMIHYNNNAFYITRKGVDMEKIALYDNETKTFRQLADIELSKEEFIEYFENGKEALDFIENISGQSDYKIHTQGYVNFYFSNPDIGVGFFQLDESKEAVLDKLMFSYILNVWYSGYYDDHTPILTKDENLLYGIDANNLVPR
ncbi:MAG: hypothetical protein FWG70_10630 [Oscillospiraceae bacterium]|nr:hypothetical protein [Oscillospiraceae bacterium]